MDSHPQQQPTTMDSHHQQPAATNVPPTMTNRHSSNQTSTDTTMPEKHSHIPTLSEIDSNPQNWPVTRKIYVSMTSFAFTFALLYSATSYAAGIPLVAMDLGISMEMAIIPFGLFFLGIAFAPLYTPHWSERMGRNVVYYVAALGMAVFMIGASRSTDFASLCATRFFAGFFGGPIVVNIEGTFADVWPATYTITYYAFLVSAQYLGAATGVVLGGTLVVAQGWRYTQYVSIIITAAALLFGLGAPDSYPRQIQRNIAKVRGVSANLEPALSGSTFASAAYLTCVQPLMMLVTEPIVTMIAVYLSLNFGVLFQWFVSVPNVLNMLVNFTPKQAGLAFISGIGGTVLAFVSLIALDQVGARMYKGKMSNGVCIIEYRMWSAIIGSLFIWVSLFWIANTATPQFSYIIPVVGTAFFVWGSMMQVAAFVGYLFDAYPPQATLSALTACAVARVLTAGWVPMVITYDIQALTGKWAFGIFGFIAAALFVIVPFSILFFGTKLRSRSGYMRKYQDSMPVMQMQQEGMMHGDQNGA